MIASGWLLALLTIGAVIRLTRLVTEDVVSQPARRWLISHRPAPTPEERDPSNTIPDQDLEPREDWLVYLVHCRWCASIWISGPVATCVWFWPDRWFIQIPILALTASLLAGLSGRWE